MRAFAGPSENMDRANASAAASVINRAENRMFGSRRWQGVEQSAQRTERGFMRVVARFQSSSLGEDSIGCPR